MPEVKGLPYRIFWPNLALSGAQQNVALNRLRYKVAMPLPGVKNGLHAVDQPLAFELHQHCAAADDGYAQAHTVGEDNGGAEILHIILARAADRKERKHYENQAC